MEISNHPLLCLNMIVKNESHIIKETLTKLLKKVKFDYWVISDTGSNDDTKEIIIDFFKELNITGELFEDEWKDFGYNRTLALNHAFNKSKYLMVFDADDEIIGDFVLPELTCNSYHLQFGSSVGISYTRTQIINNHTIWKYAGVLHEYIMSIDQLNNTDVVIKGDYYINSGRFGNRNCNNADKYLKDALILERAYDVAVQNNDYLYSRYGFYCANSYYDYGQYENAIIWYKKTLDNQNWIQEKYVSCLRMYNCYNSLNQRELGFFYLVKSTEYDKERTECLYELIFYYCCNGLNEVAYGYYTIIKNFYETSYLTNGLNDKLFLDVGKSELYLPYYMIIVSERLREYNSGIQMFRIVFTRKYKETNKFYIGNMLFNLQFFIDKINEDELEDFKILFKEYIEFLISIYYPVFEHDFMHKYEKYGIINSNLSEPFFSTTECINSKKILIYTGFAPFKWNNSFSETRALGGSETAVACLSTNFSKEYQIYIAGEVEEETFENITYVHFNNLANLIKTTAFHTIIISRYLNFYEAYKYFSAYQTFIWCHDVCFRLDRTDLSLEDFLTKWSSKITSFVCQTEWHKNNCISLHPNLKDKINIIINNGIKDELFISQNKKSSNSFVYTSCSERGLLKLIQLWPSILDNFPDATLTISSYNTFPNSQEDNIILEYIIKTPSITHLGNLNRKELYHLMSVSEYWLYTSYFPETSCITSLELLASEVICLYYPVAGLVNTIGDYGISITEGNEINALLSLTIEQKNKLKKNGKEYALNCSWKNRATEWYNVIFSNSPIIPIIPIIENNNNIKIINLTRRTDRKTHMISQLERENILNYEFIKAVDGNNLKESEELRLLFEHNDFNYSKGVIGCYLSHLHIWNNLIHDDDNDYYVILEDDIELYSDFKQNLSKYCEIFQERQLEYLTLGISYYGKLEQEKIKTNEITILKNNLHRIFHTTFSYIISKSAAIKLITYINNCSIKCALDNSVGYGEIIEYYHTTCCITNQKYCEFGTDIQGINLINNFQFNKTNYSNTNLKIAYCDWWCKEYYGNNFDFQNNFIIDILQNYSNIEKITIVEPTQNPDILFYSVFGDENIKYKNVRKIFFTGEPVGIRSDADFNLTFNKNSNKNTRFPIWLGYINNYLLEECQRRKDGIINIPKREQFCFLISDDNFKMMHLKLIAEKLSKYKTVHCGGNYLNNIGYNVLPGGKIEHNKYKFAIAFENDDYPGYVTEKMCDIYKSNCIPIYWGTEDVVNDFNPSTFINAHDFANFDELVQYIIKVDKDDTLYASFFKEPIFSNRWLSIFNDTYKVFYRNIADCIIGKKSDLYNNYLKSVIYSKNV